MTTQPPLVPEKPQSVRASGPGSQLRQARLDLKLAPEDVARILHLSSRQIVALEGDDYNSLPGPTYVRGYLRGYSQFLGLSAEPILEAYNRLVTVAKPVDLGKLAPETEIRSDHQLIKFATVGVIAIVLGLSAVWWREQEPPATPAAVRDAPDRSIATAESTAPEDASAVGETATVLPTTPVIAPTAAPKVVANGVAPVKAAVTTPEPVPAATVPTPGNVTAAAPAPISKTPSVAPTGPRARLVLQAQSDSWVDIRDGHGNRLLYETVAAGRTVAIEGDTPLSVFLGNADVVRVEFNGQPYDVSRFKRGEIARFTLGETSGVR